MTQTYWLEPTDEAMYGMRVYSREWTCDETWHDSGIVYTDRGPVILDEHGTQHARPIPGDDAPWPTTCVRCGIEIPDPHRQSWSQRIWRRTDTGEERFNHSNPDVATPDIPIAEPGASWDAHWMPSQRRGADGIYLMVRLPNGRDWAVDSRASNCTLPDDNEHRCWVRHGDPRECRVTVDKDGLTCSAGAGSIQGGDWHGFLRDGVLVQ